MGAIKPKDNVQPFVVTQKRCVQNVVCPVTDCKSKKSGLGHEIHGFPKILTKKNERFELSKTNTWNHLEINRKGEGQTQSSI
jgi:hypothetical protein